MIDVTLLHEDAVLPRRATPDAAGFDLYAAHSDIIRPGQWRLIDTGVGVAFEPRWHGQVRPRSGLAKTHGIDVHAGVIDRDFRGGIGVLLMNHNTVAFHVTAGDRIAQLVPVYSGNHELRLVDKLSNTVRDNRGFGHTGK
mgnify:CR=1 FL=1